MNIETKKIDGTKIASIIKQEVKDAVEAMAPETVGLSVITVQTNSSAQIYIKNKQKACDYVGIKSQIYTLDESSTTNNVLELIEVLNDSHSVDGILVQLPLPKHMDQSTIIAAISPSKDVDGFSKENLAGLIAGGSSFESCTPLGIMALLKHENIEIAGKKCVIIGRSNIVGKPLALMLLNEDATVCICHSKTVNLANEIKTADILISAVGKAKFITGAMIKPKAVVIDVGITHDENGKLCGDVDFDSCLGIAEYITPVPGGVGPMTIAMLLKNCVRAAQLHV
ncbi:bifunctional 5,10-methylenetetrahydrofolate dehydrogenase/5,10-methenyltetrahydrofolate cyclohydrolase [Candidatus Epulonipiscium viviparus]|uniref:bifunctional 5,10-methylenetetrahydrofolate dehydrogenase/5,10-methenyltetrahydrofolate cyclohydrolase n=1 Tax=Candidatus Epulonipiscium viviparus TaxID=420336 RepID=UPI00016C0DE6|nr:bifunctional 5,10-methylenetetrahydrofolate dehydrogenase/5,10-methenyltetrahydrofolate cyclohydrolase [Candidatus Epulopiscium viviparus]